MWFSFDVLVFVLVQCLGHITALGIVWGKLHHSVSNNAVRDNGYWIFRARKSHSIRNSYRGTRRSCATSLITAHSMDQAKHQLSEALRRLTAYTARRWLGISRSPDVIGDCRCGTHAWSPYCQRGLVAGRTSDARSTYAENSRMPKELIDWCTV